jgi:hypothetical protein
MTLSDQLIERIKVLEEQHKELVISINTHEIELGIEKNQKRMISKQIVGCRADLEKIEENKRE